MEINLKQAIKLFYSKSSFDMIYQEAIANALDAEATDIKITFSANGLSKSYINSFKVVIEDNGIGFTEKRFTKFCKLLDVDKKDKTHRGLGRLAYLFYFDDVFVQSYFDGNKYREFLFDQDLKAENPKITSVDNHISGTVITMTKCSLEKLGKNDYADAEWIKKSLLRKHYSRLYRAKEAKRGITITITTNIGGSTNVKIIDSKTLPKFIEKPFTSTYSFDGSMTMLYSIKECDISESSVITALLIDNRNESIEVFAEESVPPGYEMVFILSSDSFQGGTDATRQNIEIPSSDLQVLKKTFRKEILEILSEKLPKVLEATQAVTTELNDKFPHLSGYFEAETIGISSKNDIIKDAQSKFFQTQRELVCKNELTDEDFNKSIDISGRALTEYIMFRQLTIKRLKSIDKKDLESKIHNIIVPKRTVLHSEHFTENVYKNCAWILDEKFMTYSTVLSEMEMSDLLTAITSEEVDRDDDRPDIAIIFSDDPKIAKKVEVVIIELKRKGLKPEENAKVEVQLEKRARKLFDIYPDKIQRLWLYGVAELDNEYKSHLSTAGYHPLYSKGTVFVNTTDITVDWETGVKVPATRYVMDIEALVDDADARNQTFLNIIKGKFNEQPQK